MKIADQEHLNLQLKQAALAHMCTLTRISFSENKLKLSKQ